MTISNRGASPIVQTSGVALSDAIRSKQVSCVEVMDAYLDHIGIHNAAVNAIVALADRDLLLRQSAERDAQLARGEWLGPLHGFPQAIKDLDDAAGFPTSMGSSLFKGQVAASDSLYVERMKRSGCVIIGKTNTPEFGLGSQTYNSVYGTTRNAYDPSMAAGGSSGGAAVALALRMQAVVDGSDHAGSLRNPAAFNNVFGLRPSFGRVPSVTGDVFSPSLTVMGPMARSVPDLAMLLSVQAGYDPRAPLSLDSDPALFARPLARDFRGTRVAWFGDFEGAMPFEAGVLELCERALQVFESLGCIVEHVRPDWPMEEVWQNWLVLRSWRIAAWLKDSYADPIKRRQLKPEALWEIERGLKLTATEVTDASNARSAWHARMQKFMQTHEFVLLPSAQVFPFDAAVHWPREVAGVAMDTYHRWMEVAIPITMCGSPSLNVPAGFDPHGLPTGLQIVGRLRDEWGCLQLADAYDQATRWVERHPSPLLGSNAGSGPLTNSAFSFFAAGT
ncbi:amidase [Variovorax paradoxus]|jgi:amidase|uniref:amidase n=1 Tax=Variovorax paradoxus TaxID=34073 RepID=UPI003AAA641C